MPTKPIIDIDINDEKFQRFQVLFNKYRDAVKAMPGDWADVNKVMGDNRATFEALLAAMLAQQQLAEKTTKAEVAGATATRQTASYWRDMSKTTKSVAGNILKATESLLKWVGITGIVSGLLGAGGLWGIDRMAASVSGTRRNALGVGSSYGASKAFGINFGQVVDSGGFLAAINRAQSDQTNAAFMGIGLGPGQTKGNSADVAVKVLDGLKRLADRTPQNQLANVMGFTHADQFVSLEEMNRIKAMSATDFAKYKADYARDRSNLDVGNDTQKAWMEFTKQMDRAGNEIENVFVKGLKDLAGPLTDLSDAFVRAVKDIAESDTLKHWIKDLGEGIEHFAKYLTSDDFHKDLEKFKGWLRIVADDIELVGRKLHWVAGQFKTESVGDYLEKHPEDASKVLPSFPRFEKPFLQRPAMFYENFTEKAREIVRQSGLPASLFHSMLMTESSGNPNAVSSKGAVGLMQLKSDAAREVGVTDRRDPLQSLAGGGEYLKRKMMEFGDFEKGLAAYNWGGGNLTAALKDFKRFGPNADWHGVLPTPVKDYIGKVESGLSPEDRKLLQDMAQAMYRNHTTRVDVNNATGGNSIVSTSLVGAPAQ